MKKTIFNLTMIFFILAFAGCDEETFMPNKDPNSYENPKDLNYAEILDAREYNALKSGVPSIDTDNLVPVYQVVSVKDGDGMLLDESYLNDVSISNVDPAVSPVNYSKAGVVSIANENMFGIGDYYFTINVTTNYNGTVYSNTFEDALHVEVGPQLVKDLLYSPIAQNLVVGEDSKTTQPYLITGNTDVIFKLGSDDDKLKINSETGIISLLDSYTTVENDTIYPKVVVTSNISGETTEFQGDSFLMLVASTAAVDLPKKTIYFFYPTLQAENALYGYRKDVITAGDVTYAKTWVQSGPSNIAAQERPEDVTGNKSLLTNIVISKKSVPHESDVIMNSQDLTKYSLGYDVSTVFYIKNQYVEYMADGATPVDLEIYYSTDYDGNNDGASWTQINDQVKCLINKTTGEPFVGTPYPGDQKLGAGDPDGRKDTTKNADGKWVKCEFDLNSFKQEKNFTLKFKFASYFTEPITGSTGRGGRFYISDVYFKASEE